MAGSGTAGGQVWCWSWSYEFELEAEKELTGNGMVL